MIFTYIFIISVYNAYWWYHVFSMKQTVSWFGSYFILLSLARFGLFIYMFVYLPYFCFPMYMLLLHISFVYLWFHCCLYLCICHISVYAVKIVCIYLSLYICLSAFVEHYWRERRRSSTTTLEKKKYNCKKTAVGVVLCLIQVNI